MPNQYSNFIHWIVANPVDLPPSDDLIVGGHDTTIEEHPWQVSLQFYSSHRCGGSIIGNKWTENKKQNKKQM